MKAGLYVAGRPIITIEASYTPDTRARGWKHPGIKRDWRTQPWAQPLACGITLGLIAAALSGLLVLAI
jgi:hypothetical protein